MHRGYRVVGIECSPIMAAQLRDRFKDEIADGRFVLLEVGVAAENGEMEFWVSEQHEWSSFDRTIASRNGKAHHAVPVATRRFADIVGEHGVAHFCKIDIEGNDHFCLLGMTPETAPDYISIEMSHRRGDEDIELLSGLGYTRFKIVSQVTRAPPYRLTTWLGYSLPAGRSARVRNAVKRLFGIPKVGEWTFARGSSGVMGPETAGGWHNKEWALKRWRFLHDVDKKFSMRGLGEWFDIHATKD